MIIPSQEFWSKSELRTYLVPTMGTIPAHYAGKQLFFVVEFIKKRIFVISPVQLLRRHVNYILETIRNTQIMLTINSNEKSLAFPSILNRLGTPSNYISDFGLWRNQFLKKKSKEDKK
ncbi:hypothetical protein CUJ86_07365 [Methanofollis fontis]|uniref:Uncharacterized protein n=1 Tax=Methanofollis fontis TaxID=2052832 RepID=A0A483CT74_9EURY|nr:hypothetical protein CUJ86_07365 [Methanofollis fontis]